MKTIIALWHDARYEALMRRARVHTHLAGRSFHKHGYTTGGFMRHQARASALTGRAIRHGRSADHLRGARRG